MKQTKAELEAQILFLESQLEEKESIIKRLQFYEQHYKSCRTASPKPPFDDDETSVENLSSIRANHSPPDERPLDTTDSTQDVVLGGRKDIAIENTAFINTKANHHLNPLVVSNSGYSGRKRKKWEDDAKSFLVNIKKPRYEPAYLQPLPCQEAIITAIVLGTTIHGQALPSLSSTADPIMAAKVYANIAYNSRATAILVSCIASFQDLIFHSMCAVLEYCGYPTEEIDGVMRIRSSRSGSKNLKRLRAGAVWASEVISESTGGSWNILCDSIAERYFHCDVKMSVYGSLADSKTTTKPHFVQQLTQPGAFHAERLPRQWCIPAFVKLAAGSIPLNKICEALGYDPTFVWKIEDIVRQYQDAIGRVLGSMMRPTSQQEGVDSLPPESSRNIPIPDDSSTVAKQSGGQTQVTSSAGKDTSTMLPGYDSTGADDCADTFDPLTFELSTFAAPDFELSVFASPSEFERSLVAQQQLMHSMPAGSSAIKNS